MIVIESWAQGREGLGQGGWSSSQFAAAIGEPVSISLRSSIPLETPLRVMATPSGWSLVVDADDQVVMEAVPLPAGHFDGVETTPVSIDAAVEARSRFPELPPTPERPTTHNAPRCFSCGFSERTMQVWPGALEDGTGRVASDFTPPTWVAGPDGLVRPGAVWTALDCTCGFYVGHVPARRSAVTVQYAVEILSPLRALEPYVIVGFPGPWSAEWDGRKRGGCSAIFDVDGTMMARANSFWVALD